MKVRGRVLYAWTGGKEVFGTFRTEDGQDVGSFMIPASLIFHRKPNSRPGSFTGTVIGTVDSAADLPGHPIIKDISVREDPE